MTGPWPGQGGWGGGVLPYISHIGMCGQGMVFEPFWYEIGYRF